jgi:5-methylcytosine-specific restriction protein B
MPSILQVMQKVLPRLHGSRRRLEPTLCALGRFCFDLSFDAESVTPRFDPLAPTPDTARLPISFDKVRRMTRGLRAQQFTSFTEQ